MSQEKFPFGDFADFGAYREVESVPVKVLRIRWKEAEIVNVPDKFVALGIHLKNMLNNFLNDEIC